MMAMRSKAASVLLVFCFAAHAAPFTPADDAQVLERLPERATGQNRELAQLRAAQRAVPNDLGAAVALADAYYQLSRAEGDPRYLGYAQAALAPWWNEAEAPSAVLVSRATILQSNHEFDRALADLGRVLARDARNA